MPLDLSPPPKLWTPQKPAIIRASAIPQSYAEANRIVADSPFNPTRAMPLLGTFAAASARALRPVANSPAPLIVGTPATFFNNSAANTHNFNLPSGIVSGELLLLWCGAQANVGGEWSVPSGWTEIASSLNGGSFGDHVLLARLADGTEGATVAVTKGGTTVRVAGVAVRISGALGVAGVIASTAADAGASTAPNPPSRAATAPADTENLLWLASMCAEHNNDPSDPSGYPTNYTKVASGVGTTATGATVAVAQRTLTPTSSEDPSAFTIPGSSRWTALTAYVRPA